MYCTYLGSWLLCIPITFESRFTSEHRKQFSFSSNMVEACLTSQHQVSGMPRPSNYVGVEHPKIRCTNASIDVHKLMILCLNVFGLRF